jgi:tetratricopeptide (TPR) repeat protein
MGQRSKELAPHESLHHYWGAELRALRVVRGLSLVELGDRLHCNPSYLAKIERAERPIPATLVESCDQVLEAQGTLVRMYALAASDRELATKSSSQPPEHVASEVAHVASPAGNLAGGTTFPAVPDTGEEIVVPARTCDGRVVFVSVPRRVFLQGVGSAAMGLSAIPAAESMYRITLPADVNPIEHFQQLRQVLIENGMLFGPRQVIPIVREQIGIMQRLRSSWRSADQHKLVRVQAQYTELCGWLHKDICEYHLAELWMDRALGLSHLTADHDLTVYILASKAELASDMRMAADAIGAGEQALRMAPPGSRIAALAATRAARGYALSGDRAATERTYDRARELLDASDPDPDSLDGQWLTENRITLSQAHSWTILGEFHRAAQNFQGALTEVPNTSRLSRGTYLARAARAHAGDGEVEQATTLGREALAIGADTRSERILTELSRLDGVLAPWDTVPAVADFRAAMKDTLVHQT